MFKNGKDFQLFIVVLQLWNTKTDHVASGLKARVKIKNTILMYLVNEISI